MSSVNATAMSRLPRRQRGRDRVAALTAAAAAVFVEKGLDATTMTEIAARAGGSIGSLYLFFPSKAAIAETLVREVSGAFSDALDALVLELHGRDAATIADALFDTLADFLAAHPVYPVLVDVPGDEEWRRPLRARRREQVAALFAAADPPLPPGQPERLAALVPELMRTTIVLAHRLSPDLREPVIGELRAMLRHHLQWRRGSQLER